MAEVADRLTAALVKVVSPSAAAPRSSVGSPRRWVVKGTRRRSREQGFVAEVSFGGCAGRE